MKQIYIFVLLLGAALLAASQAHSEMDITEKSALTQRFRLISDSNQQAQGEPCIEHCSRIRTEAAQKLSPSASNKVEQDCRETCVDKK